MSPAQSIKDDPTPSNFGRGLSLKAPSEKAPHATHSKSPSSHSTASNTPLIAQLVGATNCSALARQLHPKILEGLDAALSALGPLKPVDTQGSAEQLFLKAFKNAPGASTELQQVLACNSEAASAILASTLQQPVKATEASSTSHTAIKKSLASGDYLVLQSPIITSGSSSLSEPKKPIRKSKVSRSPDVVLGSAHGPKVQATGKSQCKGFLTSQADKLEVTGQGETVSASGRQEEDETLAEKSEVESLRKHKEWADQKIDQLIRRVRDSEGPQRLLTQEVQQLRLEKDSVEMKLKDFESSLQKLKDCTYTEAAQRQEYELTLRQVQAELRGASLREQEVQASIRSAQTLLRQEKKRRESLEKRFQKSVEERAELQAHAAAAVAEKESMEQELAVVKKAMQAQALEMDKSQDAAIAAELEAKHAKQRATELQQQLAASESAAASRVEELQGVVSVLNAQLDEASSHTDQSDQESSLYSHFDGRAIFGGGSFWLQDQPLCTSDTPDICVTHSPNSRGSESRFEGPFKLGGFGNWGQTLHHG